MLSNVWLYVLAWLQRRCEHPAQAVRVDILEGDGDAAGLEVSWCEICGAFGVLYHFGRLQDDGPILLPLVPAERVPRRCEPREYLQRRIATRRKDPPRRGNGVRGRRR